MIQILHLSAGYGDRTVVRDFSLEIAPAECILLSGRNGSGKTTLMKTIAGLLPPLEGQIHRSEGTGKIVMVPTRIPKVKGFTVREFIALASEHSNLPEIDAALEMLRIADLSERDIASLSDGQFQKVCIASAFPRKAGLILLDEPTAFLDTESRIQVLDTIKEAALASGSPILFSSHDLHEARAVADREISLQ